MALTLDFLNTLMEREVVNFNECAVKYKTAVAGKSEWGINHWENEMEKYSDKMKLLREIIAEFKKE